MRADRFEDVELGAFERFYDERPFEGRSYPGPYFETEIASGMKRGLAVSVEGPTVDDARALMDQVRAIIARPLPTQEMYSALLETFPKAFPWNTPPLRVETERELLLLTTEMTMFALQSMPPEISACFISQHPLR